MFKKILPAMVAIISLLIYFLTASRFLPWGDGSEFYTVVKNLGVPHPSGYPLFVIMGRFLFSFSSSPLALNILPAIFTAASAVFLYLIILRITQDKITATALSLFFSFGRVVWLQSVAAEIYSLNLFFLLVIIYTVLRIEEDERFLVIIFYIFGLALANHLTSAFYIVPITAYLYFKKYRFNYFIFFTIIPLTLYLYFPIRSHADPQPDLFNPENFKNLISLVSGKVFHYRSWFITETYLIKTIVHFAKSTWVQFLILIPLGFYGIKIFDRKWIKVLFIIIIVAISAYTLLYNIPDKEGYYLPVYGLWLILIGVALAQLIPNRYKVLLFILPAFNLAFNYHVCNYSKESSLEDICAYIYDTLPANSIISSDDYFVYYGILNQEYAKRKGIIPICDFYLRFNWYLNSLRKTYPQLIIPNGIDKLIKTANIELESMGKAEQGEWSKKCCHLVRREIVAANINRRPYFLYIYDDADWPKRWLEYYLQYCGIYYRIRQKLVEPEIFALPLPSSNRYKTTRLNDQDAITVTKKFAAAYNRRGIYRCQKKDFDGAVHDFKQALKYHPNYFQVHSNLGFSYLAMGDTVQAMRSWKTYLHSGHQGPKTRIIGKWYQQLLKTTGHAYN